MTQTVVAFLTEPELEVFVVDTASGHVTGWDGDSSDDGWFVIGIVPGEDVLETKGVLPKATGRRGEIAAKYAVEEQLAVDPAGVHVAISAEADEANSRSIWAVAPDEMNLWLSQLAECGLSPSILIPDYALVPPKSGLHMLHWAEGVTISHGSKFRATVEETLVPVLLDELLTDTNAGPVLIESNTSDRLAPLSGWGETSVQTQAAPRLGDMALRAAEVQNRLAEHSLLQGDYRVKTGAELDWSAWRRPAVLAASVAAIWMLAMLVDGLRLSGGAEAAYAEAERVMRDALPGVTRVVNPRAQLRAALQNSGVDRSAGFLENTAVLNDALAESEGIRLESLRFDPDSGALQVTLNYEQYQELESLSQALQSRGARVTEGGSRQSGGRVIGDVTVRLP